MPTATGSLMGEVGLEAHSKSGENRIKTAGASTVKAAGQGSRKLQGEGEPAASSAGDKQGYPQIAPGLISYPPACLHLHTAQVFQTVSCSLDN